MITEGIEELGTTEQDQQKNMNLFLACDILKGLSINDYSCTYMFYLGFDP